MDGVALAACKLIAGPVLNGNEVAAADELDDNGAGLDPEDDAVALDEAVDVVARFGAGAGAGDDELDLPAGTEVEAAELNGGVTDVPPKALGPAPPKLCVIAAELADEGAPDTIGALVVDVPDTLEAFSRLAKASGVNSGAAADVGLGGADDAADVDAGVLNVACGVTAGAPAPPLSPLLSPLASVDASVEPVDEAGIAT